MLGVFRKKQGWGEAVAKRFTDTTKWSRKNYRLLSPKLKCAWTYVTDNCDHAGIWHPDFELMSFQIGEDVSREEFFNAFGEQIMELPNGALFFPKFLLFQYGEKLSPTNNTHKAAIEAIRRYGVVQSYVSIEVVSEPLPSPSQGPKQILLTGSAGAQDKDQDQDTDLKKGKGGAGEKPNADRVYYVLPSTGERTFMDRKVYEKWEKEFAAGRGNPPPKRVDPPEVRSSA